MFVCFFAKGEEENSFYICIHVDVTCSLHPLWMIFRCTSAYSFHGSESDCMTSETPHSQRWGHDHADKLPLLSGMWPCAAAISTDCAQWRRSIRTPRGVWLIVDFVLSQLALHVQRGRGHLMENHASYASESPLTCSGHQSALLWADRVVQLMYSRPCCWHGWCEISCCHRWVVQHAGLGVCVCYCLLY